MTQLLLWLLALVVAIVLFIVFYMVGAWLVLESGNAKLATLGVVMFISSFAFLFLVLI